MYSYKTINSSTLDDVIPTLAIGYYIWTAGKSVSATSVGNAITSANDAIFT